MCQKRKEWAKNGCFSPGRNRQNNKTTIKVKVRIMRYGVPYKGSKNRLAARIVELLPQAGTLVDLFAGGCAVTHAALLSGKFGRVVANDLDPMPGRLFADAVNGRYADEKRWISREEFFAMKDTDPYIRYCWSFGNNGKDYMYAKEIEPLKRAVHHAVVLGDPRPMEEMTGAVLRYPYGEDIKSRAEQLSEAYIRWYAREVIGLGEKEAKDALARMEAANKETEEGLRAYLCDALKRSGLTAGEVSRRLGSFMGSHYSCVRLLNTQSLQRLQRLQRLHKDYREVEIPSGAVVYCDPPYAGTSGYGNAAFDHEAFYGWARAVSRTHILFVSEYSMPEDFVKIRQFTVQKLMGDNDTSAVEGIYVHREGLYFTECRDLFSIQN